MKTFDFLTILTRYTKRGTIEVYPEFDIIKSEDLMIRGGDFYAIWIEEKGLWSTDEQDAIQKIDQAMNQYVADNNFENTYKILYMRKSGNGSIDKWRKYCQCHMRDSFCMLDEKLIFANTITTKTDYASKKLKYALEEGPIDNWNRLLEVLYSEEERHKIEWAIGSIVAGASKKLQKFLVFYGSAGTGKSTILNIIMKLFNIYTAVFDAKALGSSNNSFALESFKDNPLVAIQHDGDLSRIEDNTRLNSLVSHEMMTVNEKFKSAYANSFKCFLFMGTNKPVKITDARSGLIRRLIDVSPTGNKLSSKEYTSIMNKIDFELGAIAYHCKKVFTENKGHYDHYIPLSMLGASNDFYNFIEDSWYTFNETGSTTLTAAWEMYKAYCEEAKVPHPYPQRIFKEELKNYFGKYSDRKTLSDGTRVRRYYYEFKGNKFREVVPEVTPKLYSIDLQEQPSYLDRFCEDCLAQYGSTNETPISKWAEVKTTLLELSTDKLHYILPNNKNHIVIDFDLVDENGEKSYTRNLEEANKWPKTYAELSKGGKGIHLHYIYSGDVTQLSRIYEDKIEVKVFTGNSSLRRKLTKCNDLPIATISGGLPLKGVKKVINFDSITNEKALRTLINKNLKKAITPYTKPSMDFIFNDLKKAKESGLKYDVSDLRPKILAFAANSSNNSEYCIKLLSTMEFKSDDPSDVIDSEDVKLVFFDVEVFPNLLLVNWKIEGENKPVVRMINPTPQQIEELMRYRLVGFNCRRYDNHILYARLMGYNNEQIYRLSCKIINGEKDCFFGEAYNVSYTDVYDFSSKKQSLKKFEIELGLHHQEFGLPWNEPVPEKLWGKVAEYCDNDVIATEATFNARKSDFLARQILADIAGMTVNDTTNSISTRIIFGNDKKPQSQFNYRNLAEPCDDKPYFPGYVHENGKSTYRGEEIGEGGYVYAKPGIYTKVALLDVVSMHPRSTELEGLFGPKYTKNYSDIKQARVAIKHKDFDTARTLMDGKLSKYLDDTTSASDLAQALKIVINSVYGLTAASFNNPFRDARNKDNIVAKRGALFMVDLKNAVWEQGYEVAHIKTDSIKIPNADEKIIQFVKDFGLKYGYEFEHEATYERMCLVNDAVYIAKYADGYNAGKWVAVGTQFQVPYVFKTLFSRESIEFDDMCETKQVSSFIYLDLNEDLPESEHSYKFVGKVGNFCPVKSGYKGGVLLRKTINKNTGEEGYASVTGTKGYRWLESEEIRELGPEKSLSIIDRSYYDKQVDTAISSISKYGDPEWFIS